MSIKQRVIAVHLLNDLSGSPLVLQQSLHILKAEYDVHLFTADTGTPGALSGIGGITTHPVFYRWSPNKWATLLNFMLAQLLMFWSLLRFLKKDDIVYINTLLPAGAALAGRLRGCRVVMHIHEVTIRPGALKRLLTGIADRCASHFIFVSQYVREQFSFRRPGTVVYNSLPQPFIDAAMAAEKPNLKVPFTALMLCSLREYKGIYRFVALAKRMSRIRFLLVVNASDEELGRFREEVQPPPNCFLYPAQRDTTPFYRRAHVVLNLSDTEQWIETFGMTILEGMYFGLPAIVPPVGGPRELVSHGREGFCADSKDEDELAALLVRMSGNLQQYMAMSEAAASRAAAFAPDSYARGISQVFGLAGAGAPQTELDFHLVESQGQHFPRNPRR